MSPPVAPVAPDETLPGAADVVVIGGGIVGVSAAWHLAKQGVSVALCEKGIIGGEQSSRNWGYVRQQGRHPAELPLIVDSLRMWRGLDAETGEDTGFVQGGVLYAADDPAQLAGYEAWLEHARPYQLDSRLLSRRELAEVVADPPADWIGGLYTASDGRAEPALAAPAIARAARRAGATLHTGCAVRGLVLDGGRVSGVATERGEIRTQAVICAAGAWAALFCRRHGIALPQLAVRASVQRTSPGAEVFPGGLSAPGFSIRRRADGGYTLAEGEAHVFHLTPAALRWSRAFMPLYRPQREHTHIRFGWPFFEALFTRRRWPLDAPGPFEDMRILDPKPDRAFLDRALAAFRAAFPAAAAVQVVERWAGMIDVMPDELPVIGPVAVIPGFFLATGFSGHGFGIGPAAGRLAAEIATGAPTSVDPAPFRLERFAQTASRGSSKTR
jgi:glycine/D-amino acid oxidase-like deaminating enzyme